VNCDELLVANLPKVGVYDNCDDDVKVLHTTSVTEDLCSVTTVYDYWSEDDCGNRDSGQWKLTVVDSDGPTVHGGKHCIYNRTNDGYGSNMQYKVYNLDDLVSAVDDCDDNPQVQGVWFNRTHHDKYDQLTGHTWQHAPGNAFSCSDAEWSASRDEWSISVDLIAGKTYVFTVGARQSQCSPTFPGDRPKSVGTGWISVDGGATANLRANPPQYNYVWSNYEVYFTATQGTTKISLWSTDGIVWSVPVIETFMIDSGVGAGGGGAYSLSLVSHVGSGLWQEVEQANRGSELMCQDEIKITSIGDACGAIRVTSNSGAESFEALPIVIDDRFTYQSKTRAWMSIEHVRINEEVWWVLTSFAATNPAAYAWVKVDVEITKQLQRRDGSTLTPRQILQRLADMNTIVSAWPEKVNGSPIPDEFSQTPMVGVRQSVTCPDVRIITNGQCQGACYYSGFGTATKYGDDDLMRSGQCWCGRDCMQVPNTGNRNRIYSYWKWFEGFFFDSNTNEVWILAHTDTEELNIFLWVQYADQCGNSGVGKVEFWIAPSLESAAAQGRTCDEADADSGAYVTNFAFTSSEVVAPAESGVGARDNAVAMAVANAFNFFNGLGDNGVAPPAGFDLPPPGFDDGSDDPGF